MAKLVSFLVTIIFRVRKHCLEYTSATKNKKQKQKWPKQLEYTNKWLNDVAKKVLLESPFYRWGTEFPRKMADLKMLN